MKYLFCWLKSLFGKGSPLFSFGEHGSTVKFFNRRHRPPCHDDKSNEMISHGDAARHWEHHSFGFFWTTDWIEVGRPRTLYELLWCKQVTSSMPDPGQVTEELWTLRPENLKWSWGHSHGFTFAEDSALEGLIAATALYIQDELAAWSCPRADIGTRKEVE